MSQHTDDEIDRIIANAIDHCGFHMGGSEQRRAMRLAACARAALRNHNVIAKPLAIIDETERLRCENRDLKLAVSALILTHGRIIVTRDVLDRAPGAVIRRTDHPSGDIVFQVDEVTNG